MSLPTDPRSTLPPGARADQHADPLVASAVRAAADAPVSGAPAADCPDAELLGLYAERGLAASDLALVETHLDGCPRCQAIVAACVRALPEGADPTYEAAGASDPAAGVHAWFAGWRWLVPITSVAAVAMVAVWIGRGPADQVAQHARVEGVAPDERVSEVAPNAAPATLAPMSADARAMRDAIAGAAREADAGRLNSARALDAAAAPAAAPQERRALRREDAQATAAAPEQVPDARQLAEAPAVAGAPPREQYAARERAEAAPAAPPAAADAARAPAPATLGARASSAAAGSAGNEVAASKAAASILTGSVTYRARVALPPGAVIEVRLLDVSRADPSTSLRAGAPADILAQAEIVTRGEQVPVAFSLTYDPDVIQARRRYVVYATISVDGRAMWRTTTQHPVFVDGAAPTGPVTIVVEQIR